MTKPDRRADHVIRAESQREVQRLAAMDTDSLVTIARKCSGQIYMEVNSVTDAVDGAFVTLDRIITILGLRAYGLSVHADKSAPQPAEKDTAIVGTHLREAARILRGKGK